MLAPKETLPGVVGMLAGHCVKGLREEHQLVLAARTHAGRDLEAIGVLAGYSRAQVARRWDQAKEWVLAPLGLGVHDDLLTGILVMLHADCCTAPSILLLKNDSRFQSV